MSYRTNMLQSAISLSFSTLLILLPLVFSSRTDELFEFNKIIVLYCATIAVGFLWILRMIAEKRRIFRATTLGVPWVIFLISQILSTLFSMHSWTSWLGYYSRFNGGLASLLCYAVLYFAFVSNARKKDLSLLMQSALIGGGLAAIYAIPEHFGHSISCWLMTGQVPMGVDCWVQDVQNRIFGTFGQPNWLAAYMIGLTPVSIAFAVQSWKTSKYKSVFYSVLTGLFFTTLLFTKSRSGFLGLVLALFSFGIGLGVLFVLAHRKTALQSLQSLLRSYAMPVILLAVLLGGLFTAYGESVWRILVSSIGLHTAQLPKLSNANSTPELPSGTQLENGGTESGVIRSIVWSGAIQVWKRYPLFGSGVETFAYSYYLDRPQAHNTVSEWDFLYNKAHNEWLNYLATTGAVGLISYLLLSFWIFFWVIKKVFLALKKQRPLFEHTFLPIALLSGLLAIHMSNILGFSTVAVSLLSFSIFPAVLTLLFDSKSESTDTTHLPRFELTTSTILGSGITLLFAWQLFSSVLNYWNADLAYTQAKAYSSSQSSDALNRAIQLYKKAESLSPQEALFPSEYAAFTAELAAAASETNDTQLTLTLAQESLSALARADKLNSVHLNFKKAKARSLIQLSKIDPNFLREAYATLEEAHALSPTDPKITYNLGVLAEDLKDIPSAKKWLETTILLKPDYATAKEFLQQINTQK